MATMALFSTGCFDLETEIKFLEDGSGFVTQWVRMDLADVAAAAALAGTTVDKWTLEVTDGIDDAFFDRTKVRLFDKETYVIGQKLVLRYRYLFHSTSALNEFLSEKYLVEQLVFPAGGHFSFTSRQKDCGGDFAVAFTFDPRGEENIENLGYSEIDRLPLEEKVPILAKFYSGKMNLRIVMPGKTSTHTAGLLDGGGRPVYQSRVLDFLRKGIKGKVTSIKKCVNAAKEKSSGVENSFHNTTSITTGSTPTPFEIQKAARGIPHFLDILYEFECDDKERVRISATFYLKEPLQGVFEFYFPLLFGPFPRMESDYKMEMGQASPGLYKYKFVLKKPIKLSKLKSRYVFYGKEKGRYVFRMNLPKMKFGPPGGKGIEARALLKVKVTLPAKIRISNATSLMDKTAVWDISDLMTQENKITIEAISE